MEQIETKTPTTGTKIPLVAYDQSLTKAAELAIGLHALTEAVARLNASGGGSLTEAVARLNASGGGSLTETFERCRAAPPSRMDHGVEAAVAPAAPPSPPAPITPASPALDPRALEILHKCADAAERVHRTGRYAAAAQAP
ncbi:hypothetical protein WMF27_40995 [Sorangium sp. So ce281]|uniref:hypothetical protein n=1 Tax=unclassified Sorangium TaxID=2621164 RepID=UPI003F5DB6CB